MAKYQKPDALTTRLVNPLIATLTTLGLSVRGAHVLVVRGRTTGKRQEVPVKPRGGRGRAVSGGATGRHAMGAQPACGR